MAVTNTIVYDIPRAERISRNLFLISGTVTLSGTYVADGFTFDLLGVLRTVINVQIAPDLYNFHYSDGSVITYYGGTGPGQAMQEVVAEADLTGVTFDFIAIGLT